MNNDVLYTHILLCERLCFSEGKTQPSNRTETSKFISSLALILNGNATCTAVSIDKTHKLVYIARNEPISSTDQRYFDHLFRAIRIYADLSCGNYQQKTMDDAYEQIKSLVIEYNAKKILNRLIDRKSRTIDQFKAMSQWSSSEKDLFVQELQSNRFIYTEQASITEKFHWMKKNRTEEEYVNFLLNIVKRFLIARDELIENQQNLNDEALNATIDYALVLYQSRLFHQMLHSFDFTNLDGMNYLEKVTAHYRSMALMVKCLLRRKGDLAQIYSNIAWRIVPTVEKEQKLAITPQYAFERIFNDLCDSMRDMEPNFLSLFSSKSFYDEYCNNLKVFDKNPNRSVHLHAEISLIDYLLENEINGAIESKEPEIGISKLPCFLCSTYINLLNEKYDRCFALPNCSNGKIYSKWCLRQSEDPAIVQAIDGKVREKIKQSIKKICAESERSGIKRSGDSDLMATSLEEDEFDEQASMKIELRYDCSGRTDF